MGTIGTLGGFFQLSNLLSGDSRGNAPSSSPALSPTEALIQSLDAAQNNGLQSGSGAFTLDLSPQAQQLLDGNSASGGSSTSSSSFTLSQDQQNTIKDIIEKYKDTPLTQATFEEIQSALAAAGLSPQTLAAEDQIKNFNSTGILLSALNGYYAPIQTSATTAASEQSKEANYLQSIVSLWQNIGSQDSSNSGTSGSDAPASSS